MIRRFDLFRIANDLGARLVIGKVDAVEADNRRVILESGEAVSYNALVIAAGGIAHDSVPAR